MELFFNDIADGKKTNDDAEFATECDEAANIDQSRSIVYYDPELIQSQNLDNCLRRCSQIYDESDPSLISQSLWISK